MKEFIDASVFLGMHSKDEKIRVSCKNFFVNSLKNKKSISMSLEQVGKCDDVIWRFPRKKQDAYYPFMDNLHTLMKIERVPYTKSDFELALKEKELTGLDFLQKLTISMAICRRGVMYTIDSALLSKKKLPVIKPAFSRELYFPKNLEELYQKSLELMLYISKNCQKSIYNPFCMAQLGI